MTIDLLDPALFANGHPAHAYAHLRAQSAPYWNAEKDGPGFWAVTRYADVWAVDHDHQTYSSEPTIMIADPLEGQGGTIGDAKMMLMMDPPEHTAFRKLIRGEFAQDSAVLRTERLVELARQIVNGVIERGECDFVHDIAGEMPSYVIAELMGLPLDDGRELYKLTEIIHSAPESLPPNAGRDAVMKMFGYGMQVIAEKRARPADDLATKLLQAEVDGRKLTDPEFLLFFLLLIDAGGDTTRNLLASGLVALANHPAQWRWLMEDLDARLPAAREELLRFTSPVIYMRRTARKDARIGDAAIRQGQKVVMYFGAANREGDRFEHPETLNLARTPNEHIAFGGGPHNCLGRHLARIEIDAMLREVFTRMKAIEIAGDPVWLPSTFISGPKSLPIRFAPARRV
jgi:cytochrome P450